MSYLRLPLACLLAATAAAAQGADEIGDVRFSVALVPPTKDAKIDYSVMGESGSESVDGAGYGVRVQIGLAGQLMPVGSSAYLFGMASLFYSQQSDGSEVPAGSRLVGFMTGPIRLGAMGVQAMVGLSFPLTNSTHLEIGPFVGFGQATISDRGVTVDGPNTRNEENGHGDYLEYGATLAIYSVSETGGVVFGAGITYFASHSEADLRFNVVGENVPANTKLDEHVEIDQSGLMPYVTFGLRF